MKAQTQAWENGLRRLRKYLDVSATREAILSLPECEQEKLKQMLAYEVKWGVRPKHQR